MPERFFIDRKHSAIVIVDIQERLASVMDRREKVVKNSLYLIETARLLHIPLILTEQYTKGLGATVGEIRDSFGTYEPIEKITFDCCRDSGFNEAMASSKKKKIILAGMEAHVCVLQTCLSLMYQGYTVHVVKDAVCSRSKDDFKTGIEFMRDAGAVITCTETVLFQLLEKAGTDEFKAVSKMIK